MECLLYYLITTLMKDVRLYRMARAGADVVGVNCHFDPFVSLEALRKMKQGLDAAGLKPYLMCQPLAYHTPDASKQGFIDLPEFPFALESRICTR